MQVNIKKELRNQKIEQALRNNLKKRKIFQNTVKISKIKNKEIK